MDISQKIIPSVFLEGAVVHGCVTKINAAPSMTALLYGTNQKNSYGAIVTRVYADNSGFQTIFSPFSSYGDLAKNPYFGCFGNYSYYNRLIPTQFKLKCGSSQGS